MTKTAMVVLVIIHFSRDLFTMQLEALDFQPYVYPLMFFIDHLAFHNMFHILGKMAVDVYLFVPVFMLLSGIGIAGIWTVDIIKGRFADRGGFFYWREGENMLWPHILAEYLTSLALIIGSIGLYTDRAWGLNVSFAALGALLYTAINSSAWVLAKKSRMSYGIPMWFSIVGAVISFFILLA